ncbi:MAG: hypothetical protein IKS79_07355 [Bacteroidales bacterium]|nr:hypothetical protein [Bacteroidales bacterium]
MTLRSVAQIAKGYGKEGELLIRSESDSFSELLQECEEKAEALKEPVFIYFDGVPVPFFINSVHHRSSNAWVVTFSTIRDNAHAEEVVGRDIFQEGEEDFSEDLNLLVGFTVLSEEGVKIGTVGRVIEYPSNICLEIKETETLLPFHEELLLEFNRESKTLRMRVPEGII